MSSEQHSLHICVTCREKNHDDSETRPGKLLYDKMVELCQETGQHHAIKAVKCLVQCDSPCAISINHPDKFSYLLNDISHEQHQDMLLEWFQLYKQADDGIVPFAKRPKILRAKVKGRIPPIHYHEFNNHEG